MKQRVDSVMQNTKLLIVDDDEDDYILARALLNEISPGPYSLDWAPTFTEGEALLKKNEHDLCLMDYQLGSDDGIKLLKRANELGFTGPIILLTGMHQGELDREALEAGAVDYLVKAHLTAEQLARSIRYALGRREMERERMERIRAESENRLKSEFLAHLSHELRTPLSAILGFTELLINKSGDAETLAHLRVVDRNGKHLLGLLNDILDLSKIEAGKLELENQEIHLASFLTDIYALMHGSAVDKNLLLRLDTPTPLPTQIVTDPIRLRQVLLNLIGNAVKFTDQGEVAVLVAVDSQGGREKIRFSVKDTGMGIKTDIQEAVFQPFVQVRDKAHPRAGTGLGLAISKQLVTWLGGDISLTSEPGKGSEFIFTIDPGDIAGVEREVFSLDFSSISHSHVTSIPRFKGRVLVVDDLRDIRLLIGHFVEATGLEVVYAHDGVEAERIISEENWQGKEFDVVLMDIHMPERDGLETARKLRESGFTKPLVALTAAHMKGDVDICLASGFSAYLSKPVDQHQIHACLARYFTPLAAETTGEYGMAQRKPASDGVGLVLLVEDDPDALQATSGLLTLLGWDVIPAGDASEAVEEARKHKPSVALVDLHLPDMDGYQLAAQLHMVLPDVKVVIASGEEVDADRASRAGVSTGLLKPFSIDQLERVLRKSP